MQFKYRFIINILLHPTELIEINSGIAFSNTCKATLIWPNKAYHNLKTPCGEGLNVVYMSMYFFNMH